jgi:hypothetical protein
VTVGDFSTPLSPKGRSSIQKLNKETLELNDTIDQMDWTDTYTVFHSATAQYAFFSATHGTFSKIYKIRKQALTNIRKLK